MTTKEAIKELWLVKSAIEWEYSLDWQEALDVAISALEKQERERWRPVMGGDGEMPEVNEEGESDYVLVNFSNVPDTFDIAQYREDENGGAFYSGDSDRPYSWFGIYVSAWRPLPELYRGGRGMKVAEHSPEVANKNGDLIKREDVRKLIESCTWGKSRRETIDELLRIPAAQPEITFESAVDYLHSIGWLQEYDRILTLNQWHSAYDRPPEIKKMYWVQLDTGSMCSCQWTNASWIYTNFATDWHWVAPQYTKVVAWRELPEEFQGE